jgi:GWxTD domain-containing protein
MTRLLLLGCLALLLAPLAPAQADDPLAVAEAALRDGAYRQAERTLRLFVDAREGAETGTPEGDRVAEAYYLLSRLYTEQPDPDTGQADAALGDALRYDPDNPTYLTAQLVTLRADSWNFIQEKARERQRLSLARQLLALDSTNAVAHEELGTQAIRDFWFYRNAIALPDFRLARATRDFEVGDELVSSGNVGVGGIELDDLGGEAALARTPSSTGTFANASPTNDPFNIDQLTSQGAAVVAFSRRADRAYDNAIGHLEAALRYDARRRPVYERMMELYALSERYEEALPMLQRMFVHFPEDEEMWRFLGLANLRVGNHAGAAKSFDEALERMTPERRAAFEDLSLILPPGEVDAYRADPEGYRSRYWTSRNPRFLTPYNERKIEHYARLTYADLLYESDDLGLPGWAVERGRILVRYGPPPKDITIVGNFEQALHAFGFNSMQQENQRGFEQTIDMAAAANVFNVWDYGDFKFVFEDPLRNGEFRLYSPPADVFADVTARFTDNVDFVIQARETFREQPESYGYEAPGRQVQLPYLTSAFRGDDGRTDLYVHYGVPVTAPDDEAALQGLTVRTGTFLVGEDRDLLVERRRTLYGLNPQQVVRFQQTALWVDTQKMPTTPGDHELSVEFETVSGQTMAVQRRAVDVPAFEAGELSLSDLLLAYRVEDVPEDGVPLGEIARRGYAIQPAPWAVFSSDQPVYLYFEVYGLRVDGDRSGYDVEAQLVPKDQRGRLAKVFGAVFGGGPGGGVSVEFPVAASAEDDGQYVILDPAGLETGLYTLRLRVRDQATGEVVDSEQELYLE